MPKGKDIPLLALGIFGIGTSGPLNCRKQNADTNPYFLAKLRRDTPANSICPKEERMGYFGSARSY
jgi:hypothetical protein